ncbi:MAG: YkgJ family cysteine cluster protein [Syntrophaceae bacterium]
MEISTVINTTKELFSKIEFADYDVLIPFICLKSGRCCKTYMPHIPEKDMPTLALYLHWPMEDMFNSYSVRFRENISSHRKPCIFLNEDNLCRLYNHPLRPPVCRSYPFSYEGSDESCPGYQEHHRLIVILTTIDVPCQIYDSSFCPNLSLRRIPSHKWREIIDFLWDSKLSSELEHKFIAWNHWRVIRSRLLWEYAASL